MARRKRLPSNMSASEIETLLPAARQAVASARTPVKMAAAMRDLVMIETARLAGARVAELCNFRIEDLNLDEATLSIQHGKGDKDRNVPIADKLIAMFRQWIGDRKSGWLFPGPKGRKLSTRTFERRLKSLAAAAGIAKRVYPHRLRHTFATSYLRIPGANIHELQQLLGHSSLQTTSIYLHVEVSRMKAAIDKL